MWRLAHNYLPYLSREFWEVLDIHKRDTLGKMRRRSKDNCRVPTWFVAYILQVLWYELQLFFGGVFSSFSSAHPGAKESVDRWEMCIVTTQKYFRLALGSIYSKNNVGLKDTRNGVSRLFFLCCICFVFLYLLLLLHSFLAAHIPHYFCCLWRNKE